MWANYRVVSGFHLKFFLFEFYLTMARECALPVMGDVDGLPETFLRPCNGQGRRGGCWEEQRGAFMKFRLVAICIFAAILVLSFDSASIASSQKFDGSSDREKPSPGTGSPDTGANTDANPVDPKSAEAGDSGLHSTEVTDAPASQEQAQSNIRLNIKGTVDANAGESRRNDNIQFNPIDNNAIRDLSIRIGASATVIREFDPQNRYFSSEYGTRPETTIHVVAPSQRVVHGSVFETHSNSVFNARSFFQVGGVKPAHENNYGFTLGAPLGKGLNLMLDAAQQKVRGSVNGNVLVPSATERTPLTNDSAIRPIVEQILSAYPAELPNRPDIDSHALNTNSPQSIDTNRVAGTLDRVFGVKNHLIMLYSLTSQKTTSFQFVAGQYPNSDLRAHSARITWNHIWTQDTVADFSVGFDRVRTILAPEEHSLGTSYKLWVLTSVGNSSIPTNRVLNDFTYAAQVRRTTQRHVWTSGASAVRHQFNGSETNNHYGTFMFVDAFGRDAVTNLRMGTPISYTVTIGKTARGFRNWGFVFYIGDKWRATENLTLNFGLRYELVTRPVEVNNLDVLPYSCDCNNLAPSFGFAYRFRANWGIVRGAYSIQYGQIFPATYGQERFNPPANIGISVDTPNLANPLAGFDVAHLDPNTRSSLTVISPDLVVPYSHQYNFSWEPGSWEHIKLQLGYVGSRTLKLFGYLTTNRAQRVEGIPTTLETVNQRRPDPNHYLINEVANSSRAYYDAARVSLVVPPQHGLSLDVSYWFSKSIDVQHNYSETGYGTIVTKQSENLGVEDLRGPSIFDQPHALLTRGSLDSPALSSMPAWVRGAFGKWNLTGVWLLKSGTPFSVFAGSDAPGYGNVDGESGDRIDILDPSILHRTIGDPDTSTTLLPRSAFKFMSPTAIRGNAGRDIFRKGKISNVNVALSRTWQIRSEKSLTFRAESINLFNTPQFADPERNFVSKLFGRISNTLNSGRSFQFTMRLSF